MPNQPGPASSGQHHLPQADGAGLPLAPASGVPAPSPQTGNIPGGTPGATALVPTTYPGDPHLQDMLDNLDLTGTPAGTPSFKVTLPHLFQDPIGSRRLKVTDPQYVLTYPVETDMDWDSYNLQLSSQVDFLVSTPPVTAPKLTPKVVQPNARAHGQFAPPPLAQSGDDPKYPKLPNHNHSPYGPPPT